MAGQQLFARYAYPPNALGYCGPADASEVLGFVHNERTSESFETIARCFEGTWPYFEFIAAAHGLDPLDEQVIESYWLGGHLTAAIDVQDDGQALLDELAQAGGSWARSRNNLLPGMDPDHNFHVFAVYPWLGLLSRNVGDQPRLVLDRCRIRWGTVVGTTGEQAIVMSRSLLWDGSDLALGDPTEETAQLAKADIRLAGEVYPGDNVALHWDWICDRLTNQQLNDLHSSTMRHIDIANRRLDQQLV